jgi:hypothetical protein
MAGSAPAGIEPLQEWQECRTTVARFDGYLSDTRKYGFTLVTLLLTANALITTGQNTAVDRPAASIVVMALLLALFMLDNYYWDLLKAAVKRAAYLEELSGASLSDGLTASARRGNLTEIILIIYGLFVVVAVGIAFTAVWAAQPLAAWGYLVLVVAMVIELALMFTVYAVVQRPARQAWLWKPIDRFIKRVFPDPASPQSGEISGI